MKGMGANEGMVFSCETQVNDWVACCKAPQDVPHRYPARTWVPEAVKHKRMLRLTFSLSPLTLAPHPAPWEHTPSSRCLLDSHVCLRTLLVTVIPYLFSSTHLHTAIRVWVDIGSICMYLVCHLDPQYFQFHISYICC